MIPATSDTAWLLGLTRTNVNLSDPSILQKMEYFEMNNFILPLFHTQFNFLMMTLNKLQITDIGNKIS